MIDSRSYILDRLKSKAVSIEEFNFDKLTAPPLYSMFSPQDIYELNKIAKSLRYAAKPQVKYQEIDKIMRRRGFVKFIAGTNRVVYRPLENDTFLVKVAADAVGLGDNPREFVNQQIFKPFVTKVFEVSPCGTIGVFERVVPITSREEYLSVAEDVFTMINEWFIGEYVLEDIGTRFFMNIGIRKGFGPVLLDFPYVYKLDGDKLFCNAPNPNNPSGCCEGVIDYDDGYNFLYCTKCGVKYKAKELAEAVKQNNVIVKSEGDIHMKFTCKGGTLNVNETVTTGMYAGMAKATPVKPVKKESKGMKLKDSSKKENVEETVGEDDHSPSATEIIMYKETEVPTVDHRVPYAKIKDENKESVALETPLTEEDHKIIDECADKAFDNYASINESKSEEENEVTGIPEWVRGKTEPNTNECVDDEVASEVGEETTSFEKFVLKEKETEFGYASEPEDAVMVDKTVNGVNATPTKVSPIEFMEESEVDRVTEFSYFIKNHFKEIYEKSEDTLKDLAKELLKNEEFTKFVKEYVMKKELENNKSTSYREGYSFGLAECGSNINKLKSEIFVLEQNLEKVTKEKESWIAAYKEKDNRLNTANEELNVSKEHLERFEKIVEDKDKLIEQLQIENFTLKEDLDKEESSHKDIVTGLESTIEELSKRDTEGLETITKRDEEIKNLKEQLDTANNIIGSKDTRINVLLDELEDAKNEIEQLTSSETADEVVGLPEPSEKACDPAEPEVPTPKTFGDMVTELAEFVKANKTNIREEDVLNHEFVYDLDEDEILKVIFGKESPYDIDVTYENIKWDEEIEKLKVQLEDANNIISSKDTRINVLLDELEDAKDEIEQLTSCETADEAVGLPEPSEEACDVAEPEAPTPKTFGEIVAELAEFVKANKTSIKEEDVLDPEFVYDLDEILKVIFGEESPYDIDVTYENIKWDEENDCMVIVAKSTVTRAYTVNGDELDKLVCEGNGYDITVSSEEVLNILKGVSIKDTTGEAVKVHTLVENEKEDLNALKEAPTAVIDNVGYNGLKFYSSTVMNAKDLDTTQNFKKCIVVLDEEENYLKDRNGFIIMIDVLDDRDVAKLSVVSSDWLSKLRARNEELEKVEENYNLVVTGTKDGDAIEGSVATAVRHDVPVDYIEGSVDSSKVTVEATESVKEDVVEEPNEYGVMDE